MYINSIILLIPFILGCAIGCAIVYSSDDEEPLIVVGGVIWSMVIMWPIQYTVIFLTGV